ncbi:MAG: tetratricopeptide repeat protein [Paludisphaera borealis]|uniref:multiheme c-type cytochrome n=1 Tax=Paludisphaera borealis TaxID=1387353 RepID=UPI0028454832|nr:tetratricopeptide repeat protein [Paludisphaera borealis]MDR3618925.1 tetratricopeptide repeat protein [Paludisphaera borealis]
MTSPVVTPRDRSGRAYKPAIGSRLRPLLWIILVGFALLAANGFYLSSVTALTWYTGSAQQTFFYMLMVALHLFLGLLLVLPFVVFSLVHLASSWKRPNKTAVNYGLVLLAAGLTTLISGFILVRIGGFEVRDSRIRELGYWMHVVAPVLAVGLYVKHRLAGPRIRWKWARRFAFPVVGFAAVMGMLHFQDPRSFSEKGPREGKQYFYPSEAVTSNGKFIPADSMMMDHYCLSCHKDAYDGWFHSAHHISSFNNKAYLTSVRETRKVALERDGSTQAARWCAGCHDPVPFFSGEFDDPNYDDVNTATSQAGITCTVCHAITTVNNTRGNAAYTIEQPDHYPFAFSDDPFLKWINHTLVKAKPEMHKKTFLKPVIKSAEFCSTCHKVGLPYGLNHYKDFVRGQDHYTSYLLSGVSGHGARSFYYPPVAKTNCAECHMELKDSNDFGARDFEGKGGRQIHNHQFLAANTALGRLAGDEHSVEAQQAYLMNKKVRIDLFAIREGGGIDGELFAPLRPNVPTLKPGARYLVETVVRTLGVGHPFSQGTVDSNEIWVEMIARSGGRIIGRSGGIGADGSVDPYAHFINVYMLDRDGKRIDRRNPQDIFIPLYNKQIPPGAGQVVHFALEAPRGNIGPITLEANLHYRKFDRTYMDFIFGKGQGPELPITRMAYDVVELPVEGGPSVTNKPSPIHETWQRWNDYGIGLLLEGGAKGGQKGELKQAEEVFKKVAELGRADGWVNLARVYQKEGRIPDALSALEKAASHQEPAAPWTINWLTGQINSRNGLLDEAVKSFESVLETKIPERKFDFSLDFEVINELASASYARARIEPIDSVERKTWLKKSIAAYRRTLKIEAEDVAAHYGLGLALGDPAWGDKVVDDSPEPSVDSDALVDQLAGVVDRGSPAKERVRRALKLAGDVSRYMKGPRPRFQSRLDPLYEMVDQLSPVWDQENDPLVQAAVGRVLERTHKALHERLKPDETAEGRAFANARRNDPAANMNAQSIVIHPLNRPGAPGFDVEPAPTAGQPARQPASTQESGE